MLESDYKVKDYLVRHNLVDKYDVLHDEGLIESNSVSDDSSDDLFGNNNQLLLGLETELEPKLEPNESYISIEQSQSGLSTNIENMKFDSKLNSGLDKFYRDFDFCKQGKITLDNCGICMPNLWQLRILDIMCKFFDIRFPLELCDRDMLFEVRKDIFQLKEYFTKYDSTHDHSCTLEELKSCVSCKYTILFVNALHMIAAGNIWRADYFNYKFTELPSSLLDVLRIVVNESSLLFKQLNEDGVNWEDMPLYRLRKYSGLSWHYHEVSDDDSSFVMKFLGSVSNDINAVEKNLSDLFCDLNERIKHLTIDELYAILEHRYDVELSHSSVLPMFVDGCDSETRDFFKYVSNNFASSVRNYVSYCVKGELTRRICIAANPKSLEKVATSAICRFPDNYRYNDCTIEELRMKLFAYNYIVNHIPDGFNLSSQEQYNCYSMVDVLPALFDYYNRIYKNFCSRYEKESRIHYFTDQTSLYESARGEYIDPGEFIHRYLGR